MTKEEIKEIVQEAIKEALDRNRRLDELYDKLEKCTNSSYHSSYDIYKLEQEIAYQSGYITETQMRINLLERRLLDLPADANSYTTRYYRDGWSAELAFLMGDITAEQYEEKAIFLNKRYREERDARDREIEEKRKLTENKKPEKKSWFSWA